MKEHEYYYAYRRADIPAVRRQQRVQSRAVRLRNAAVCEIAHEHYRHNGLIGGEAENKCRKNNPVHTEKPRYGVEKIGAVRENTRAV